MILMLGFSCLFPLLGFLSAVINEVDDFARVLKGQCDTAWLDTAYRWLFLRV